MRLKDLSSWHYETFTKCLLVYSSLIPDNITAAYIRGEIHLY